MVAGVRVPSDVGSPFVLGCICVTCADVFLLERLELLLGAEFVGLCHCQYARLAWEEVTDIPFLPSVFGQCVCTPKRDVVKTSMRVQTNTQSLDVATLERASQIQAIIQAKCSCGSPCSYPESLTALCAIIRLHQAIQVLYLRHETSQPHV